MRYVVAVSGGVDSVVLLDSLVAEGTHELVVAHFDHGIREDSAADARFVAELAKSYGLPFETKREELGKGASEETARERRYQFLIETARKQAAELVTAHHADDLVETIAINLQRGTGWRGLAVFGNLAVFRPLLTMRKSELYDYALTHSLEWVEDETNASAKYLRNTLRRKIMSKLGSEQRRALIDLWQSQSVLRQKIDSEAEKIISAESSSRYFFTHVSSDVGLELLRAILARHGTSLTRPARSRMLHAIKTAASGTTFQAGGKVEVSFTEREFIVKVAR
jgi:tRNA(Ile)-lysidine synthase